MKLVKLNVHLLNHIGINEPFLNKKEDNGVILKVSKSSVTLTEDGDSESFDVTSNTSWAVKQGNQVKWNDGDGYMFISNHQGNGDGVVAVSSDENEGISRSQYIRLESTDKSVGKNVNIAQNGLRQRFVLSDYSVFRVSDGGRFAVLEKELPYTPLSYLESTGTQYIKTGHAFKDDYQFEITFENITPSCTVFGGRTTSVRTAIIFQHAESSNTVLCIAGLNSVTTPFIFGDLSKGKHTIKMSVASNKGSAWVDGVLKYSNVSFNGTYISGTPQAIFGDAYDSSTVKEFSSSKVYSLKMWQSGKLVRDFIPVLDANNKPCMYDKVNDKYYYNSGTGDFKIGK